MTPSLSQSMEFGLNIKKQSLKSGKTSFQLKKTVENPLEESDEEEGKPSFTTSRSSLKFKQEALEDDPNIFDYDASYDQIKVAQEKQKDGLKKVVFIDSRLDTCKI